MFRRRRRESSPHKSEGAYYLWRDDELDALLGVDSQVVKLRFGIQPDGNAPQILSRNSPARICVVAKTIDEVAQRPRTGAQTSSRS